MCVLRVAPHCARTALHTLQRTYHRPDTHAPHSTTIHPHTPHTKLNTMSSHPTAVMPLCSIMHTHPLSVMLHTHPLSVIDAMSECVSECVSEWVIE